MLREESPYAVVAWIARRQRQVLLGRVKLTGPVSDADFAATLALVVIVLPSAAQALAAELPEWLGLASVKRWLAGRQYPVGSMRLRVYRTIGKLVRADTTIDVFTDALDRMDGAPVAEEHAALEQAMLAALERGPATRGELVAAVEGLRPRYATRLLTRLQARGMVARSGSTWSAVARE
jgi:hypothetical protein